MARSAKRRETGLAEYIVGGLLVSGATLSRNPVLVGGSTAFLVTLFYVSANAIWYQPGMHAGAVFATRPHIETLAPAPEPRPELQESLPQPSALPRGQEETSQAVLPAADPAIEKIQSALAAKGLYPGAVDGLAGPQTRQAIAEWQRSIGAAQTGELNDEQLTQLLGGTGEALPPLPVPRDGQSSDNPHTASVPAADPRVMQVQAGLKAFGNEGIEIDGLVGPETTAAIREFQTLFGLKVTGEVDAELLAKMRDVGLTN